MSSLDEDLRCIMVNAKVPYGVIANFAKLEYASLGDFVEKRTPRDQPNSSSRQILTATRQKPPSAQASGWPRLGTLPAGPTKYASQRWPPLALARKH